MGATYDDKLWQRTLDFIKVQIRDQDLPSFFDGLAENKRFRRRVVTYFKEEYETVSALDLE